MYRTKIPITKEKPKKVSKDKITIEINLDEKSKQLLSIRLGEELFCLQ
ncbi:hypothetical protein HY029_01205 [Candidatus Gottesmanbacteria bacterium]|nr:hypothetical protein [Candidatus Gottesmanbacteria bacterium]